MMEFKSPSSEGTDQIHVYLVSATMGFLHSLSCTTSKRPHGYPLGFHHHHHHINPVHEWATYIITVHHSTTHTEGGVIGHSLLLPRDVAMGVILPAVSIRFMS